MPVEYRTWLSQRVAPLVAEHGLDRQRGGAARQVDAGIATGVPGDAKVGFPAGSLPARELTAGAAIGAEPAPGAAGEQLSLL